MTWNCRAPVNKLSIVASYRWSLKFDAEPISIRWRFNSRRPTAGKKVESACCRPTPYDLVGGTTPPEYHFKSILATIVPWNSKSYHLARLVPPEFWSSDNRDVPARTTCPRSRRIYDKYKGNDKVAVFAVCLDHEGRTNAEVAESARLMKINVPVLRDPDKEAGKLLEVIGPPLTLFIDAKGVLQDCSLGGKKIVQPWRRLHTRSNSMLAGESRWHKRHFSPPDSSQGHEIKAYEHHVDQVFAATTQVEVAIDPKAPPAAKSTPKSFHLVPLWKSAEVRPAGNMLALPLALERFGAG